MTEDLQGMMTAVIGMIVVLITLPVLTDAISGVSNMTTVETGYDWRLPELKIDDPLQKGIVKNIGTGILIIILIMVSGGIVMSLKYVYGIIAPGV